MLAIRDELTVDGLVLRYKVEETDDGFSGEEGTFTICSFWLVSALCEIGEFHKARKLCAKLLSFAGPLELYGEEIDPHSGQHLGNFPQAFTHLALINAVLHVIHLEEEREVRGGGRCPEGDRAGEIGEPPPQLSARQSTRCRTALAPSAPAAAAARVAACPLSRPRTRCLIAGTARGVTLSSRTPSPTSNAVARSSAASSPHTATGDARLPGTRLPRAAAHRGRTDRRRRRRPRCPARRPARTG